MCSVTLQVETASVRSKYGDELPSYNWAIDYALENTSEGNVVDAFVLLTKHNEDKNRKALGAKLEKNE